MNSRTVLTDRIYHRILNLAELNKTFLFTHWTSNLLTN